MFLKSLSMFSRCGISVIGGLEKSSMSSANNANLRGRVDVTGIPWILEDVKICLANGSSAKLKSSGDKGHPCLVSLCSGNAVER